MTIWEQRGSAPKVFEDIKEQTGIAKSSLYKSREKAISRGWNPKGILDTYHVDDAPRSGRLKVSTVVVHFVIATVTRNSTTHGWSCARIAQEIINIPSRQPISASTVYRVLKAEGYGVFKRMVKPGLRKEDIAARLKRCLDHEHWGIEQWKQVIWSDKTSVQIGGVRGKRRV